MTEMSPQPAARTRCCIVGGGPAGMMLGFLLARAGVETTVLEKHKDFLRDFRGDTIHPSTLQVMHELGLLEDFLKLPHQELRAIAGQVGGEQVTIADFSHLPARCRFIALMPQWDFLDFLGRCAARYPCFRLHLEAEATRLVVRDDRIVGVGGTTPHGLFEISADLVVGADGRHSVVRQQAALPVEDLGAPMDVLWMRLSRRPDDEHQALGRIEAGRIFIMLDRGDYWQCGMVIPKGRAEEVRRAGLPAFRDAIAAIVPSLRDRVGELTSFDDVKLLTVGVDRASQWCRPGLLCIGDAAHTMSPIGGVGINLAIQDAVAAANLLAAPLRQGGATLEQLRAVQRRREFPTRATQRLQLLIQERFLRPALGSAVTPRPPLVLKLLRWFPYLRRFPARLIGLGFRPEHVRTDAS